MIMSTLVEKLAITLQRAKTQYEVSTYDLVHELPSQEMGSVFQNICDAIKTLETVANTDAVALMAAEDAAAAHPLDGSWAEPRPEATRWYIETDAGGHLGPYTDYDDCCADAARLDGRITVANDDDDCDDDCDPPGLVADEDGSDVPASAKCPNCHKAVHGCPGHGTVCLCGCRMVSVDLCECRDGFTCGACATALANWSNR